MRSISGVVGTAVAVRPERLRARRVEDDEQDVDARQPLAQRVGPRVVDRGHLGRLKRVGAALSQDPGRDEAAPGKAGARSLPHREADPHDVASPTGDPHHLLARVLPARFHDPAPDLLLAAPEVLDRHAKGRRPGRGTGRRQELRSEAELGRGRQLQGEADDGRAEQGEARDALRVARVEGARSVAPQQVLERRVGGGSRDQRVEGRRQLPLVAALRVGIRGRGRRREDEPEPVVARLLRLGGKPDAVAVADVVQLEALDGRAVQPDLDGLLLHPSVGGRVEDRDARAASRPTGRPPRPRLSTRGTAPRSRRPRGGSRR